MALTLGLSASIRSSAAFITSTQDTCLDLIAPDSASASIIMMSDGFDIRFICARGQRREAALEIGDQIADVLEPDVEAQRRAARRPFRRGADGADVDGNGEAFEAAPGCAHAVKRERC